MGDAAMATDSTRSEPTPDHPRNATVGDPSETDFHDDASCGIPNGIPNGAPNGVPNGSPSSDSTHDSETLLTADVRTRLSGITTGFIAALRFLFPIGGQATGRRSDRVPDFTLWLVPIGLLIGLIWAGGFRLSWRLFGETGSLRLVPSLTVVLVECLLTGGFMVMGLARTSHVLAGDHPPRAARDGTSSLSSVGILVLCLTVLTQFILILSIRDSRAWWPSPDDWRYHFNYMYPRPIFRPLLLAPIWGRWGILLAGTVGRTAHAADAETRAVNRAMRPSRLVLSALIPLVLTAIYCSRSRNIFIGIIIGVIVFAVTFAISVAFVWRSGGQSRQSLYAAGQVAQLAFLAVYRAFGGLIDG